MSLVSQNEPAVFGTGLSMSGQPQQPTGGLYIQGFVFVRFFPPAFNMGDESPKHYGFQSRFVGKPLVKAQMLRAFKYTGVFDNYGIQRCFKQGNIMAVSPGHC
jgi:hypothetical protein